MAGGMKEESGGNFIRHVVRTVLVDQQAFLFGYTVSFTGATLKAMVSATKACGDSPHMCSTGSLIASIASLCAAGSGMVVGPLADWKGRRIVLVANTFGFFVGYGLMASATSAWVLIVGRSLTGVAMGVSSVMVPVYVAETSPPHLRGRLGSLTNVFISLGILCVFSLGLTGLGWRTTAALGLVPAAGSLAAFVGTRRLPETPRFLAMHGALEDAREAAKALAGVSSSSRAEETALVDDALAAVTKSDDVETAEKRSTTHTVLPASARRSVLVGVSVVACFVLSGNNCLQSYMDYILLESGVKDVALGAACFAATQFLFAVAMYLWIVHRCGRRPLLIASCVGAAAALRATAAAAARNDGPLVVFFFCAFIAAVTLGLSTLSMVYASEVFPDALRGRAMAASTTFFWLASFVLAEAFPSLKDSVGVTGVLDLFALFCLTSALFCFLFVVESKDKSLSDIQRDFALADANSCLQFGSGTPPSKPPTLVTKAKAAQPQPRPPPDELTKLLDADFDHDDEANESSRMATL